MAKGKDYKMIEHAKLGILRRNRAGLAFLAGLLIALTALGGLAAYAQETSAAKAEAKDENPYVWKPRVTSVAVFKNGLGFFIREGEVELRDGWCVAKQVPPAAFGTLAIYSLDEDNIVDIVGSGPGEIVDFDGTDAPEDTDFKRKRLEASKHLKVELTYKHKGSSRKAAGKLVSVGPEFVVLEAQESSFAVPVEGISRMQILELPLRIHVHNEKGRSPKRTRLGMAYLRKGVTWIPEYTLKVLDEKTGQLTLRGTVVNEAEDLIHCDVHFVVGVPHFLHTDYMAPIAVGQVIRTMGAALAPSQISRQIMNRAAIVSNEIRLPQFDLPPGVVEADVTDRGGDIGKVLGNLPKMGGAAATDYTVYTKKDLTLRRREKAIVTLFVKKIKYSHVYRWSPPARMQHFLVLHNETDTAWTTGPCLAVSKSHPLTEDLLKYTPKGGNCELPVTTAVNVAHDKSEKEIDRKLKAHSPRSNYHLDLVTLEGTLQLRNFEKRLVDVIISVPVPGKPISASDEGAVQADPTKLKLTERAGTVRWQVTLEPGERKTFTYRYERYVPSG